jgi:hypothetical protein
MFPTEFKYMKYKIYKVDIDKFHKAYEYNDYQSAGE